MTLSVFDQGPPPPCPVPFNMAAHVLARAQELADKPALIIAGKTDLILTFAQIENRVLGFAAALRSRGLNDGDRVLLRLGNTADFPITYLGCIAAGCVPVPSSAQLTEPETARIIAELDPKLILHDPSVPCPDMPNRILPDEIANMQTQPPASWAMGDPERIGYIVYTSGTSGQPRAVCHAHRAIWARKMMHQGWYDLSGADRMLHAGAFNWTFTLGTGVMDPWSVGATAIIPAPQTPPDALPDLMRRHRATLFAAAPGIYRKILADAENLDLPDLRHGLAAGEKLSARIAERWLTRTGTAIHEAYGQSECSTFLSSSPARPAPDNALGFPQNGRRIAIIKDAAPVPIGQPGHIAIHRSDPGLMRGYLGDDAPCHGDWFDTGDQGVMNEDGSIGFLGRADDLMNAGGYRVSPLEIEAALQEFATLQSVAVAEVPVKQDVTIIVAFYTAEHPPDPDDLQNFAASRLARYKCPKAYQQVAALPTGPNGKLHRKSLPALFRSEK